MYEALCKQDYQKAGRLLNQPTPRKETTTIIVEMTTVSLSDDQKTKHAPDKLQRSLAASEDRVKKLRSEVDRMCQLYCRVVDIDFKSAHAETLCCVQLETKTTELKRVTREDDLASLLLNSDTDFKRPTPQNVQTFCNSYQFWNVSGLPIPISAGFPTREQIMSDCRDYVIGIGNGYGSGKTELALSGRFLLCVWWYSVL